MKIALVYNLNTGKHDYEAEFDSKMTIDALTQALSTKHEVVQIRSGRNFPSFVRKLVKSQPDVIFNVAEGFAGPAREAVYPALYDQLGLVFTGPDATNLIICHNKALTKKLWEMEKIQVPRGKVLTSDADFSREEFKQWQFPLVVKLNSEGSGLGLDNHSVVNNAKALDQQIRAVWQKYHQALLIEEYITGRDLSMVYIEGLGAMGPCEVVCTDNHRMYDFEHKTTKDHLVTIRSAREISNRQREALKNTTLRIAEFLDIKGYAKIDFRMTDMGIVYVLEVNGQVSFHPQGEFMVCMESEGWTMQDIVLYIVKYAQKQKNNKNSVGIRY